MKSIKILLCLGLFVVVILLWPGSSEALLDAHYTYSYDGCICHTLHGGPSKGAGLLIGVDSEATCLTCHGPLGPAEITSKVTVHNPNGYNSSTLGYITCLKCHNPHGNGDPSELSGPVDWPNAEGRYKTKRYVMNIDFYDVDGDGYRPRLPYPQIRQEFRLPTDTDPVALGSLYNVIFVNTPDDWGRSDGRGLCNMCHGTTHNDGEDCTACHDHNDSFNGAGCTGCHDGLGAGALAVNNSSSHSTNTIFNSIGVTFLCEDCHVAHESGDYIVPNNSTVGINYGSNGESGISLADPIGSATTEAEICWNCHDTYGISEWGLNSDSNGGASNYDF